MKTLGALRPIWFATELNNISEKIQELEQKSAIQVTPPTRPVYQPDLPSPQEGQIAASSRQPVAAEPFDGKMQIQNGDRENIEGPGQE